MVRILSMMLLLLALALFCAAKGGGVDFTNERFFRYGMDQAGAEEVLRNEKDWKIMYRVDTTTASSIACVYQGVVFYQVDFYEGRCYRLEKRAEVPQEQVDPSYKFYLDKFGDKRQPSESGGNEDMVELSTSSDEKHVFARWNKKDRVIALSADSREAGVYMLTYEEYNPLTQMDAEHEMDQEIGSGPQEVDPITGKPRLGPPQTGAGEGEDGAKPGEGQQDNGKKDEGKKDDGKKDEGGGDTGGDGHDID